MLEIEAIVTQASELCTRLECDGATRVLNYLLRLNWIPHTAFMGEIRLNNERFYPHFWIELTGPDGEEYIIDIKSDLFIKAEIQKGLIKKTECKTVYTGESIDLRTSRLVFGALTAFDI